jgi:hypothetical protein
MKAKSVAIAMLVAVVGLGLVGCTPTPTVLPDVVVEHEGSAELDGNETVAALRATQLAQRMAWNAGDFTVPPLIESTTVDDIDDLYRQYFSFTFRDKEPEVYVGPRIWAPISVETTDESIELTVCVPDQDRTITNSDPETSYDLESGVVSTYFLEVDDAGRVDVDHENGTQDECDASAAEVVTFDPAPTLPKKISEGDIRKPAGE